MLTLVAFIAAIAILVAVHELGHFGVAVACGVKVLRFSIGFGPRLLGWTSMKSGTEYVISLLPLGGFVKMLDEREGTVQASELAQAFNVQPLRVRTAIVAAGPIANLLFAIALYSLVNWTGVEQAQAVLAKPSVGSVASQSGLMGGETVRKAGFEGEPLEEVASFEDLRWWLMRGALAHRNIVLDISEPRESAQTNRIVTLNLESVDARKADAGMFREIGITGPFSLARIGELSPNGAALKAGVREGDKVLGVDQITLVDAAQLRDLIRMSGEDGSTKFQRWFIDRDGTHITIDVLPKVERDGDHFVGRVGAYIGAPPAFVNVRFGVIDGFSRAVTRTWEVSGLTLKMMMKIITGDASLKNLSGPLTIADYAGKSAAIGLTQFLVFLALISISLGVLNLLPVPVLDGGHLMYYLWESVTGKPVSELWLEQFQKVGLAVLLVMMSVALFNDATRLLG